MLRSTNTWWFYFRVRIEIDISYIQAYPEYLKLHYMFTKGYVPLWTYEKKTKTLSKDCAKGDNSEDIPCIFMYTVITVGTLRFSIPYIACVQMENLWIQTLVYN